MILCIYNNNEMRDSMDYIDTYKSCLESCTKCLDASRDISVSLFERLEPSLLKQGANIMKDCEDICEITLKLLERKSNYSKQICSICADICNECLNTHTLRSSYHFQKHINTFEDCEEDCRKYYQSYND